MKKKDQLYGALEAGMGGLPRGTVPSKRFQVRKREAPLSLEQGSQPEMYV
jgi:hypothetical protein